MTPIGIKLTLDGQREVSQGIRQVGADMDTLSASGGKLGVLSQGMDKAALSAGQLRMATQQLPLQFQDIVVSLQAGQAPLTVFLQQGSQIAGSFGGAAAAAKAMAGYVLGLITPVTVLGAGVAALGVAYYQGSKEQDAWIKGIVTTGNASGTTTSQLREYARQIDEIVGTQRQAAAALTDFVSAGVRGGDELRRYTEAAVMWEKATGQAVSTTAKQFADLQNAPLNAVVKLNEGTNFLTVSVYEQIKALEAQGNKAEAARVAMDSLDSTMRDRAKQIDESLGYIEAGWRGITGAASEAWDAMLGVGRKKTNRDLLVDAQAQLDTRGNRTDVLGNDDAMERGNAKLRTRIQALQDLVLQEDLNAAAQAASAKQTKALIEFDGKYAKALEGQITLQQKLERTRADAVAAGKSEADIKKVLAHVTEEHNKSLGNSGSAAKQAKTSYETLISTINQKIVAMQSEAVAGEKLTETEKLRARLQEELATKGREYTSQQRADIEARLQVLDLVEQQAVAAKNLAKAHEDDAKALERLTQQRERSLQTLQQSVVAVQDEERAAAMAAASNISAAEAVALLAQARAEDAYQQAVANGEAPQTLYFLEQEMGARRKLAEVMGQRTVRESNEKAAKEMAREWEKMSQTIGDTLADYIMGGGKDAATYLKRLFSTLVLQPVVQAGVGALFGMAGGSSGVGGGGVGAAASVGQSAFGALNNVSSLYSAFSGGLVSTLGGAIGSLGATLGSSALTTFAAGMKGATLATGLAGPTTAGATGLMGAGAGFAAALPWVAGGLAIASLFGGDIVSSLFGRKLRDSGIEGTFGGEVGFTGNTYEDYKGGLFRKSKTVRNPLDEGTRQQFADQFIGLRESVVAMGDALGLVSDSVAGATYSIQISLKGLSEGEVTARLQAQFDSMADSMAGMVLATSKYSLEEERRYVTLQRLATHLTAFNATLEALGLATYKASVEAANGAYTLIAALGGMDNYGSTIDAYYQSYYSEAEKVALATAQLTKTFTAFNEVLPTSSEAYRAMVERYIAASESGDTEAAAFAATLLSLSGVFKQVADSWKSDINAMSSQVLGVFNGLGERIASLIADVASDRKSILRGDTPMTADELRAGIGSISTVGPSLIEVNAAAGVATSTDLAQQAAKAASDAAALAAKEAFASAEAYRDDPESAAAKASSIASYRDHALSEARKFEDGGIYRSYSHGTRVQWMNYWYPEAQRAQAQLNELQPALDAYNAHLASLQAEYDAAKLSAEQYAQQLVAADEAFKAAKQAELQAQAVYASEMAEWIETAGVSVGKLSDLRGEVVGFYEDQAQAVQDMLQSAGNIRGVVDQLRLGQLNTAQTTTELGGRYAKDYSMALSTTGTVRAGYVDNMAANLSGLTQALQAEAATSEDWRIQTAKLFAQASNAASLLEGDASADDYQDITLELLDSIDAKLAELSGVAQSAENLIVEAIKAGTSSTLDGLRAVVAALKGEAIPAFATGGWHVGGMRLVGENGPELEVTGPARYWNASQTAAMLGGGGGAEVLAEMRALRQENQQLRQEAQAHALANLDLQEQVFALMKRWDQQGTPNSRPAEVEQA